MVRNGKLKVFGVSQHNNTGELHWLAGASPAEPHRKASRLLRPCWLIESQTSADVAIPEV